MAREVRSFSVTIPAGTAVASPVTVALAMPARHVRRIRVRFPPGPRGVVGFALGSAGVRVIPWGAGQWLVADGEAIDTDLDGYIESGAWEAQGYNLGTFDHTIQVVYFLDPLGGVPVELTGLPLTIGSSGG